MSVFVSVLPRNHFSHFHFCMKFTLIAFYHWITKDLAATEANSKILGIKQSLKMKFKMDYRNLQMSLCSFPAQM